LGSGCRVGAERIRVIHSYLKGAIAAKIETIPKKKGHSMVTRANIPFTVERMSKVDTAWLRMDAPSNLMMIVGVWIIKPRSALRRRV
jgi:hypothetical protein